MLSSFFESIKFVAHLLPVSFLRIFLGYVYLKKTFDHIDAGWLDKPILSSWIGEILPSLALSKWHLWSVETLVIPYWKEFAFLVIGMELAIGVSFLLGYLARPMAIIAGFMVWIQMSFVLPQEVVMYKILFVVQIFLAWVGAGRVLGIDYYFYKKQRGLWW